MWFFASRKQCRQSFDDLDGRLAELESRPVPEPWTTAFGRLERNLDDLVELVSGTEDTARGHSSDLTDVRVRQDGVDARIKELVHAISEGIERTARAERRIGQTVARARAELKKRGYTDPGIEAEGKELRLLDADGGDEGRVPEVPEDVGSDNGEPSSVSGVSRDQLRRARGF